MCQFLIQFIEWIGGRFGVSLIGIGRYDDRRLRFRAAVLLCILGFYLGGGNRYVFCLTTRCLLALFKFSQDGLFGQSDFQELSAKAAFFGFGLDVLPASCGGQEGIRADGTRKEIEAGHLDTVPDGTWIHVLRGDGWITRGPDSDWRR